VLGAVLAPGRAALPVALAVAVAVLLVTGARSAAFGEDRPAPTNAFYAVEPATATARFASFVEESDAWTASFFGEASVTDMSDLLPNAWPMRSAPAPVLDLPVPTVEVVADEIDGPSRRLTLRLASARGATSLVILVAPATPVESLRLDGRPVHGLPRPNGWSQLAVYGPMWDGVELELVTRAGATVDLALIDATDDLLDQDGLSVPPRPSGMMPAPARVSDAVLVVRRWSPDAEEGAVGASP
jgi:hypothetical protein